MNELILQRCVFFCIRKQDKKLNKYFKYSTRKCFLIENWIKFMFLRGQKFVYIYKIIRKINKKIRQNKNFYAKPVFEKINFVFGVLNHR